MTRLLLVVLAVFLLPACGGEEGAPDDGPAQGGAVVDVTLSDFEIQLGSTDLEPGTYTFLVVNEGGAAHAFVVDGPTGEAETAELGPGESAELEVDLSEAGEYELYCPVNGHRGQGMETALAVGGGGGTNTDETTTEEDSGYRY